MEIDQLADLTRFPNYFDYISFYTIYCKFWELDSDHDLLLRREDLMRYENYSLSSRIVDRIFEVCRFSPPSVKSSAKSASATSIGAGGAAGALSSFLNESRFSVEFGGFGGPADLAPAFEMPLSYQDFVYFILSEVDTTSCSSIEMWFQCLDCDGDGVLSAHDLHHLYEEQLYRMEYATMDVLPFEHMYTQLLDMVRPANLNGITLRELKESGQSADIFHLLFNLNRFESDEQRYPLDSTTQKIIVSGGEEEKAAEEAASNAVVAIPASTPEQEREKSLRELHRSTWYQWALAQYQAALGEEAGDDDVNASATPSSHDEDGDDDDEDEDSVSDSDEAPASQT